MSSSRPFVWCVLVAVILLWNSCAGVDGLDDHVGPEKESDDVPGGRDVISSEPRENKTESVIIRNRRGSGKHHEPSGHHQQLPHLDESNLHSVVLSNRPISKNTRTQKHELKLNGVEIRHLPSRRRHSRGLFDWLGENTGVYEAPKIRRKTHLTHIDEPHLDPIKLANRSTSRRTRSQKQNLKVKGVQIGHLPSRRRHSRGAFDWFRPAKKGTPEKDPDSDGEPESEDKSKSGGNENKEPKKGNVTKKEIDPKKTNKKKEIEQKGTNKKKEIEPKGQVKKKDLSFGLPSVSNKRKSDGEDVPKSDETNGGATFYLNQTNPDEVKIDGTHEHGTYVLKPENIHYSIPSYTFDFNAPLNMKPIFIQLPEMDPINTGQSYAYSNVEPDRVIAVNSRILNEEPALQQPRRTATEAEHLQEVPKENSKPALPDEPHYKPSSQSQYPQMYSIPYSQAYAFQMQYLQPYASEYPTVDLPQGQTLDPNNMLQLYPQGTQYPQLYPYQLEYFQNKENGPHSQYPPQVLTQNELNLNTAPYPQTYPNQYEHHQSYPPQTQYSQSNMWQWNGGLGTPPQYQNSYPAWYSNPGYFNPSVSSWGGRNVEGGVAYGDTNTLTGTDGDKRPIKRSAHLYSTVGRPVMPVSKPFNLVPFPAPQAASENRLAVSAIQAQPSHTILKYTSDAYLLKKTPTFEGWVKHTPNSGT